MAPRAPTIKEDKTIERPVKSVAVVGAGVSGLAAAFRLKSHGLDVKVFEAEERAGGKLRSVFKNGLIWDEGANTMTESEIDVKRLLDDLGLGVKQQFPISQNKRYIVRNGRPELIPSDPISLIKTNFLSTQSKLQILLEPFLRGDSLKKSNISKVSDENLHESVGEFFQRHFGKEVVDYLVDPFVAGSSGGDPESLSIRHAFPELWNLERKYGSIIVGAIRSKFSGKREENEARKNSSGKKKGQRGSFSFHGGMQV
ncbi:protoporphyrinogen oxidase, mitochondrial-like [Macadamia integrifolia]|uniref:protoporphyrinogen oxidase, mitochondrial-like n=1 Tax=Macadamia integrifolia TaxID=60698 RepID=UPI001C4E76F2|nr:protoporphyrinogen oxidase, mitochondrial-like [Macadamia integrifolia]